MAALFLVAPRPLSGKTTLAVAIARTLYSQDKPASLQRSGNDDDADADRRLFARITPTGSGDTLAITELPAGEPAPEGGRAVVVGDSSLDPAEVASFARQHGDRLSGVVINRVPVRRAADIRSAVEAQGLKVVGVWPEDRLLASPTLGQVATAIQAEARFLNSSADRPLERTLIASISADPGQGYFARTGANTVIVRSDKPDLQLAALNAGASALIVTGGLSLLGYVLQRAEEDHIPLLGTALDTAGTVSVIEGLFAGSPFSGSEAQSRRAKELAAELDLAALLANG